MKTMLKLFVIVGLVMCANAAFAGDHGDYKVVWGKISNGLNSSPEVVLTGNEHYVGKTGDSGFCLWKYGAGKETVCSDKLIPGWTRVDAGWYTLVPNKKDVMVAATFSKKADKRIAPPTVDSKPKMTKTKKAKKTKK